jgi:hypothetical protein
MGFMIGISCPPIIQVPLLRMNPISLAIREWTFPLYYVIERCYCSSDANHGSSDKMRPVFESQVLLFGLHKRQLNALPDIDGSDPESNSALSEHF